VADTLEAGLRDCRGATVAAATLTSAVPSVATTSGAVVLGQAYGTTTVNWNIGALSGQFPVRVIGHPRGQGLTSTPLADAPYGIAVTTTGRVLVTQIGSNTMATGQLPGIALTGGAILVGSTPPHVTVNPAGTRAFVTNQTGRSVSVVDLGQNVTVNTVPLGGDGFNLLMTRDGNEVFVTTDIGRTYVLDAVGTLLDSFMVGPVSNGLAEHPTLPLMYISARDGPSVTVYDRQLHTAVDTFATGGMPQRMAVSTDGGKLYIANETLGLDIWDTLTGQRIQAIAMPAYGLALSPDGAQLLVTSAANTIRFVDTATLNVTTVDVSGITRNAAYEPSGRTALVTDQSGMVHFLR
jgi:DNA-binding beta-propeller fold protein YncE